MLQHISNSLLALNLSFSSLLHICLYQLELSLKSSHVNLTFELFSKSNSETLLKRDSVKAFIEHGSMQLLPSSKKYLQMHKQSAAATSRYCRDV